MNYPTDIRIEWSIADLPPVVLTLRQMRAVTSTELRRLADIVQQIEDYREAWGRES